MDAGKTSLTESLLFKSGATATMGSVDKGSAITDTLDIEKSRGISIKAASVEFEWKNCQINLVDTPGHIDFAAEVDRVLNVLDLVVLLVSAREGVQVHTLNLWGSLIERNIPTLIFVNKIDREGADLEQVFFELEKELNTKLFALNLAENSLVDKPKIFELSNDKALSSSIYNVSIENLADLDEDILEAYLEGKSLESKKMMQKAKAQIKAGKLIPLLFGSAKLDIGIDTLLDNLIGLFENDSIHFELHSAKVFKISYNQKLGVLAYIRSYGKTIKTKDILFSQRLGKDIKINQIYKKKLGKYEQLNELTSGDVGVISTSEFISVGDVLGHQKFRDDYHLIGQSVMGVKVEAKDEKDYNTLGEALEILNHEDPSLNFEWYKDEREFHLKIQGPIQTEVLKESIESRFGIDSSFLSPTIIYKETPSKSAIGIVRYTMPKPCWAVMTFQIDPGKAGSGVTFISEVRSSDISKKYQNEIKRAIPLALKQGIKGWEVTDIVITLLEGEEHVMHSNPGDFILATPMGILRALEKSGSDLLEPMYAFQIKANLDKLGAISSDLNQMNAQLNTPIFEDNQFILTGKVAVEKAINYSIRFNAITSGKGRLKLTIDGYERCNACDEKIRAFKGVSPLDESQWILHNRGAFKADERSR